MGHIMINLNMKKRKSQVIKNWKLFSINFLLIFFVIVIIYSVVFFVIEYNNIKVLKQGLVKNEKRVVQLEKTIIKGALEGVNDDLLFLKDVYENRRDMATIIWVYFSKKMKLYDQIRYIDENGMEVIRINYSNGKTTVVEKNKLQNKADRYYFRDIMKLEKGDIYYSKFDLNVENGQIEQPIKPTIRIGTKVYDKAGNEKGIILLNYYASNLITKFKNAEKTSSGHIFIVNSDGYFIESHDEKYNFAFMYNDKLDLKFNQKYNNIFDEIGILKEGNLLTKEGLFTYSDITIENDNTENHNIIFGDGKLKIISFVKKEGIASNILYENLLAGVFNIYIKNYIAFIVMLFISIIFAFLLMLIKISSNEIKYYSKMDSMTNVLNRRTGIKLIEKIRKEKRSNKTSTICFIDIDDLKLVNDTFGHSEGDNLIIGVIDSIKDNIRENDFIIRLGGDGFLIMLVETDNIIAEKIWKRIKKSFIKKQKEAQLKYKLSASHGMVTFNAQSNESLENMIKRADEKMYIEKRGKSGK